MPDPHEGLDLDLAVAVALRAARRAVELTRSLPLGSVRTKRHDADLVTEVDTAVERAVREILAEALPGHAVVGEEYGGTPAAGPTWYCDPVDGTTNLTAALPWTSFSLALAVGDVPLVGVVTDPWRGEVWHAVAGRGLVIDGRPAGPVGAGGLAGGVVGTEWAGHRPWPGMERFLAALAARHCTSRIMGSSTLTLAQVAAGRTCGAVIGEFHPEDHLAATLLAQEAGLAVWDESGRQCPFPATGGVMVARQEVAGELHAMWTAAMGTGMR